MHESSIPTSNSPEFTGTVEINASPDSSLNASTATAIVRKILGDAGYRGGSISIAVVDDGQIHQLNRQYLDHDYPTDVLSFLLESDPATGYLEGEVIVSEETATQSAADYGWKPEAELLLYVIHGMLHLTGLDDQTPESRTAMQAAETRYLNQAGWERNREADPAARESSSLTDRTAR